MSWTLVRRKNGAEVPIKVSVLDAFRSGPKKSGKYGEASKTEKPQANTKRPLMPKDQKGATTTNSHSSSEPEVWTPKDDKILRGMKNSGQSWKQILVALGDGHNSESQAKIRWKDIQGKPDSGVAAGGDDEEKKAIGEKEKAEDLAMKAGGKGGKKDKKSNQKTSDVKSTATKTTKTSTNSATSAEKDLKAVAAKYDENKWLAVASRHFDRTGQRISPEMAKEMCGNKN